MTRQRNLILSTDSYKFSHGMFLPKNTDYTYSYLESRGGLFPETTMFGTRVITDVLQTRITPEMVDYAAQRLALHFGDERVFNYKGWMRIATELDGKLPLSIKAVREGTVVPSRNVLLSVENTVKGFGWLPNHFEPLLMHLWYPITVATLSREIKKVIKRSLEETGDPSLLPFKLHDFGLRGVSSFESAEIGGAAHLVNFMGTDTFLANELVNDFYGEVMAGFSIPATEHMVMTIKGQSGEFNQLGNVLDVTKDLNVAAVACVGDSYNIFNFSKDYMQQLKGKIEKLGKPFVVRPDSGEPAVVVRQVVENLDSVFGHTINDKGFKVLNTARVIQGDGVNYDSIKRILSELTIRGWSTDNIAFGMGGALLQGVNRDTSKFAIKASYAEIDGRVYEIQKDPITDSGKRSKPGKLKLVQEDGVLTTIRKDMIGDDLLIEVFRDGEVLEFPTFAEIRARAEVR